MKEYIMQKIKSLFILSLATLTLLIAGCSDNDSPTPPPPPTPPVDKTSTATFNVGVSGMAVKGTMAHASVSVHKIDTTTGEMSPVSFRLASSVEPESYTVSVPAGTSDAQVEELVAIKVLEASPTSISTDENGHMSIYLRSNFSGAVMVSVTSSSSEDTHWVRCDAYTGCGVYDNIASTVLPNDGDLDIEFGEWYKADLTLTAIKYIPASDTPTVARNYTANVTVFTEIVAKILQDNLTAEPMVPISKQAISDASTFTLMQLIGADGLIENANLLADISTGLGFDLSDIGDNINLNTGNTALAQLAAGLQTVAGDGENGTLAEVVAALAASVSDGSFNEDEGEEEVEAASAISHNAKASQANNSSKPSALFNEIQQRVRRIAAIYVAIVTSDTAALDELGVNAGVRTSITDSIESAIENESITRQELINTAIEIVALVESIGCEGDECTIGDDLYANIATRVTAELALLDTKIATIAIRIDNAAVAVAAASALSTVTNVDTAIAYYESALSAYLMIFNQKGKNLLGNKANRYHNDANGWVDTAQFLVASSSEYQSLLDTAEDTAADAHMEAIQVFGATGLHVDAKALFTDAKAKLVEFNAVIPAAKRKAEASNTMAMAKEDMAIAAQTAANNSYQAAVALNDPNSAEAADAYVAAAEQALADKLSFIAMTDTFLVHAKVALTDANAFLAVAVKAANKSAAKALVDSAKALVSDANALKALAIADVTMFTDMVDDAKAKQVIWAKLAMVKATTQAFADINVVTSSGRDALTEMGEIMFDVVDEASREDGDVTDKESTRHAGWIYSFNETNMTIEASHETKGSFQAVAEISNDGSETSLMLAWGATLNETGENGATFEFTSGDLSDCGTSGTCSTLTFDGVFTSLDELAEQDAVSVVSMSMLEIMDGDADFMGTLTLSNHDMSTEDMPDVYKSEVSMIGSSGDVTFNLAFMLDEMGDEETLNMSLMVGDSGYEMKGSADNGSYIMGSIWLDDYNYGDFVEVTNGVVVTYIDGDEVEYVDLSFTLQD